MEENKSILNTIKKLLGMTPEYSSYDIDIMVHINSVFTILHDLGIGPPDGFQIEDSSTEWSEYSEDTYLINLIKTYMYLKVKMLFDPDGISSSAKQSFENIINEYEFRICNWKGGI